MTKKQASAFCYPALKIDNSFTMPTKKTHALLKVVEKLHAKKIANPYLLRKLMVLP